MEDILPQLKGRFSHYLQAFYTSQVVSRISEPSTVSPEKKPIARRAPTSYKWSVNPYKRVVTPVTHL